MPTEGVGLASYYDNSTNPAGKKDSAIESCSSSVPKELTEGPTTYKLWSYTCCCEAPKLEKIETERGALLRRGAEPALRTASFSHGA